MSDPVAVSVPETKPWWQSRRGIGLVILLIGLIKDVTKWTWLDGVDQEVVARVIEAVGFVVTAWGAIKAKQPIEVPLLNKKTAAAFLFGLLAVGSLAGCSVISPPKEDIEAIRAVTVRLPELVESNEAVYRTTIEALTKSLRKHALSEAAEQADFQLLFEGSSTDHRGVPFGPRPSADGGITPERFAEILERLKRDEAAAEAAIQDLYDAGTKHEAHADLKVLIELLNRYVMARLSRDEAQAIISQQAHDLIYSQKGK